MKKVLVVEDELEIQEIVKEFLTEYGYLVVTANDGVDGLTKFRNDSFDLIILDILMPKIDGYAVCEMIRSESKVPIIMLTALDDEYNQIKGFELQIDDYITKPFSMMLLLKRVEAVLRRVSDSSDSKNFLAYKNVKLDLDGYKTFVDGEQIYLTAKEFELLKLFMKNQGRLFTRENLINSIWDYDFIGDEKIVNTHIKNIRKKLGVDIIETIRGVGYRIDKEN